MNVMILCETKFSESESKMLDSLSRILGKTREEVVLMSVNKMWDVCVPTHADPGDMRNVSLATA